MKDSTGATMAVGAPEVGVIMAIGDITAGMGIITHITDITIHILIIQSFITPIITIIIIKRKQADTHRARQPLSFDRLIWKSKAIQVYLAMVRFMGLGVRLVPTKVFKTSREARGVSGGFDSHTVPPTLLRLLA